MQRLLFVNIVKKFVRNCNTRVAVSAPLAHLFSLHEKYTEYFGRWAQPPLGRVVRSTLPINACAVVDKTPSMTAIYYSRRNAAARCGGAPVLALNPSVCCSRVVPAEINTDPTLLAVGAYSDVQLRLRIAPWCSAGLTLLFSGHITVSGTGADPSVATFAVTAKVQNTANPSLVYDSQPVRVTLSDDDQEIGTSRPVAVGFDQTLPPGTYVAFLRVTLVSSNFATDTTAFTLVGTLSATWTSSS